MSFHSSSYLFSDCPIELGIGLIELRIGLIELRVGLIELGIGLRIHILLGIGLIELGIGLMELGIGLRINNARRTVLARVSGLVSAELPGRHSIHVQLLRQLKAT